LRATFGENEMRTQYIYEGDQENPGSRSIKKALNYHHPMPNYMIPEYIYESKLA